MAERPTDQQRIAARVKTKPLYIGLTLRGAIMPDDWRRIVQAIDLAVSTATKEMKLTQGTAYVGDDKVWEFRR